MSAFKFSYQALNEFWLWLIKKKELFCNKIHLLDFFDVNNIKYKIIISYININIRELFWRSKAVFNMFE